MQEFDFEKALAMHRAWKMKFHVALGRVQGEDFDTRPLGDASQCDLGKWLAANLEQLKRYPSVAELQPVHEEFHARSKAVADALREGRILHMTDPAITGHVALSERIERLLRMLRLEIDRAGPAQKGE